MQHCSGVAAATVGTAGVAKGIVEEGIVGEETVGLEIVEEISYGETSLLDGSSSTKEAKNSAGLVDVSKSSRS